MIEEASIIFVQSSGTLISTCVQHIETSFHGVGGLFVCLSPVCTGLFVSFSIHHLCNFHFPLLFLHHFLSFFSLCFHFTLYIYLFLWFSPSLSFYPHASKILKLSYFIPQLSTQLLTSNIMLLFVSHPLSPSLTFSLKKGVKYLNAKIFFVVQWT